MRIPWLFLIGCLACSVLCGRARADAAIEQGPVPSWAELVPVPAPERTDSDSVVHLLSDIQVHIEADRMLTLHHAARLVVSPSGVDTVASMEVERGPSDRIVWHFIRRQRDGKSQELLTEAHRRVIQPEADRDRGLLTGRLHELIVLTDIRVGDLVEAAFTVEAPQLPAAPRVALHEWLGRLFAVQHVEWRATWPSDRKLKSKAVGAELTQVSAHELRYQRDHSPAYPVDENMPAWVEPIPHVELSEYADWAEAAALEVQFYPKDAELPSGWLEPMQAIAEPEQRMAAAVRFVQDEVRYMGIEDGAQAVIPHAPAEVLSRRYGDCKDKSYLLVTLLRALGFEAAPALVSTRWQRHVTEMLPSPAIFNHVIVSTRLGDRELWIDPTQRFVHGQMDRLPNLPYGSALVLRAGETALREVPLAEHSDPDIVVVEHFKLQEGGRSRLHVETWYRNEQAIDFRERLAARSREQLETSYQEFYANQYRGVRRAAALSIVDEPKQDQVYTEEQYMIDQFWSDGQQSVAGWSIMQHLPKVAAQRRTPVALAFPLHVRHKIELSDRWEVWRNDFNIDSEFFTATFEQVTTSNRMHEILFDLRVKADSVPVAKLERYAADRERLFDVLEPSFATGWKKDQERRDEPSDAPIYIGLACLCAGGYAAVGYIRKRRATARKRAFTRAKQHANGEAPRTAIEVDRAEDAQLFLKKLRCCGDLLWSAAPPTVSSVSYSGDPLLVYRLVCSKCGQPHRRYFRATE